MTDPATADSGEPPESTTAPEGFRQVRFNAPAGACTVLLVRHGESAAALPGRSFDLVDGHGDPALHPNGVHQAELLGRCLASQHAAGETIDAIYVTTLRRTHETAAPLAAAIGLEPVVERDLREVHLGEWEGGAFRERVAAGDPIIGRVLTEERWDVIPGAEPLEVFEEPGDAKAIPGLGMVRMVTGMTKTKVVDQDAVVEWVAANLPAEIERAVRPATLSALLKQGGVTEDGECIPGLEQVASDPSLRVELEVK